MIRNLLTKLRPGKTLDYEKARGVLENQQEKDKHHLASAKETQGEILYYLAEDKSPEIRSKVAANPSTPPQADKILVHDENDDVRLELARKITRIFPDLCEDDKAQIREKTIEILEILADDQLPGVRQILSEELKSSSDIPHDIAFKLANDREIMVSAPILEYSPLLSDADLKEIIAASTVSGALEAIAKRGEISEDTSHAIATSLDIPAVATLLANKNAQIREDTLDAIINGASEVVEWHEPLTDRPNLSMRALKRIAGFVASSLVSKMIEHYELDDDHADDLLSRVRERINEKSVSADDDLNIAEQARDLFEKGVLDDEFIQNALKNKQRELVIQALHLLSGLPDGTVRKILNSRKARRLVAIAWKAGLSMRTAMDIQTILGSIPKTDFINAKDGVDYPLSTDDMEYEIALYT